MFYDYVDSHTNRKIIKTYIFLISWTLIISHYREADDEIAKLSKLAGQLNPKLQVAASNTTTGGFNTDPNSTAENGGVDLDQLLDMTTDQVSAASYVFVPD